MKDHDKTKKQLLDELKKIKIKYKNERFKLNEYFENLPILAYKISLDGKILDCNNLVVKKLGYNNKEEMIGKSTFELIASKDHESALKNMEKTLKCGVVKNLEFTFVKKDGSEFPAELSASSIYDGSGNLAGFVAITKDTTEREKAELETKKFIKTIETSREAINITSANETIIYTNRAMDELFGYQRGELIGKCPSILNAGPRPEAVTKNIIDSLVKKGYWEGEIYNKKKDGTEFISLARLSAFKDEKNNIINFLSSQHDVTEQKRMDEALKESESELRELKSACEQKNIALREVIAQVELERSKIKDDIEVNVGIVINPILEKLKNVKAIKQYVNLLQHHIEGLTSSYGIMIRRKGDSLTPREMEVCNLVKGGLSSKDISKLLNLSYRTIERHRDNSRHKLGISNKNINLTTFLREL